MTRTGRILWITGGVFGGLTLLCANAFVCLPAWVRWGMVTHQCPSGGVRQTLGARADGVGRGTLGEVRVWATGHYTTGDASDDQTTGVRRLSAELALVDNYGKETALTPEKGWRGEGNARTCQIRLPDVPDGDYLLRVRADTAVGEDTVDVPLPLYAPARVNVLTDRPLYEPGNTVQFRAVALRARDLTPLAGRPGTWKVINPSNETLLEEKAPAGDWGVVAGDFPLDAGADSGDWTVRWESGGTSGASKFRVAPFTLPRFRIEAHADAAVWFIGERPTVHGRVVYSSGAPVGGARVDLDWDVAGDWPAPTAWTEEDGALPRHVRTDPGGDFSLELPVVPADLQGQATLVARITATDPAGDRVTGGTTVLLSQDRILVTAVTELGDGLAQGFNNRLYVRATTASHQPLANTDLKVTRAWDPSDPGTVARTDEDGVAALQIDPGPAVTVVVPPRPLRLPPAPPPLSRESANEQLTGEPPSLDDAVALDRWNAALAPCARWVASGEQDLPLGVAVSADGAVRGVAAPRGGLGRCAEAAILRQRMPGGAERLLNLHYTVRAADLPTLTVAVEGVPTTPDGLSEALDEAALSARDCLPADASAADLPAVLTWTARHGSRAVSSRWAADPDGDALPASVVACVERALSGALSGEVLDSAGAVPEDQPAALGFARVSIEEAPRRREAPQPEATTFLGYELKVETAAKDADALRGDTLLRLTPGTVPALRVRATPVLAKAGDDIAVEVLRGPDFSGELPEKIFLTHALSNAIEARLDPKARTAHFALPADASGWYTVEVQGAVARVFVRPTDELAVDLRSDQPRYAPGASAAIALHTTEGGRGVPASVSLVGVDDSLSQLVALPGADALDGLRPQVQTSSPAFEVLDGQALSMGRIQGANAAAATILRVNGLPVPEDLEAVVSASADAPFTPLEDLTDHFYTVLGELHAAARAWESSAPAGEQMSPERMAKLWDSALDAVERRGEAVTDAYGRRLRLSYLPSDLLALTDPREVIIEGTRLPEDVENWGAWVAREKP